MGPEPHVQAEGAEPHPTAPAELDPLALVARDAAPQRDQPDPLLPAHVDGGTAPVVEQIGAERGVAHRVDDVRDVGNGELGRGLHVAGEDRLRVDRVAGLVVEQAVPARVGPGDGRADVVHADAQLDRPRNEGNPHVAPHTVPQRVPRRGVLAERGDRRLHGSRPAEDRVSGDEPALAGGARVGDPEVVMQRPAHVQCPCRVAPNTGGVADRRREPCFEDPVSNDRVGRVRLRRFGVAKKSEERIAELEAHFVVQPAHHAHPHALDADPGIERPAGAADAEFILRHELRRLPEVHPQEVLPDVECDVVRGCGRLLHFVVQRQVEDGVQHQDRVEPRRVGIERRILGDVGVVVKKLDHPERDGNRDLGLAARALVRGDGAVGRVVTA